MKLGIVDTMFSRVNMGKIAIDEIKKNYPDVEIVRRTVPGIKDLGVECKKLLDGNGRLEAGCDSVLALGMVGGAPIDTQCGHEASLGIQQAKLMTNKHIIEVFVHENEAFSPKEFTSICDNRIRKHAHNAVLIVTNPDELTKQAGEGVRQGRENEGPVSDSDEMINIAIVAADFNKEMNDEMVKQALDSAKELGVQCSVTRVPGAYDMPIVVKKLLMDKKVSAVVALGTVITGETAHDEIVVTQASRKLTDLSLEFSKPVTLGIIGHGASRKAAQERTKEYARRAVSAALSLVKVMRE